MLWTINDRSRSWSYRGLYFQLFCFTVIPRVWNNANLHQFQPWKCDICQQRGFTRPPLENQHCPPLPWAAARLKSANHRTYKLWTLKWVEEPMRRWWAICACPAYPNAKTKDVNPKIIINVKIRGGWSLCLQWHSVPFFSNETQGVMGTDARLTLNVIMQKQVGDEKG